MLQTRTFVVVPLNKGFQTSPFDLEHPLLAKRFDISNAYLRAHSAAALIAAQWEREAFVIDENGIGGRLGFSHSDILFPTSVLRLVMEYGPKGATWCGECHCWKPLPFHPDDGIPDPRIHVASTLRLTGPTLWPHRTKF